MLLDTLSLRAGLLASSTDTKTGSHPSGALLWIENATLLDSGDKYKVYFEQLGSKIDFYEVEPEHTYNMDGKGFMVGAVGRQKRIFSRRLFKKKQFKQMLQDGNREWISLLACVCAH
tara:strand:- start:6259 stop:6609 length:351 start_codon:yes stop_codon:yes gene_type:complete